jgi:hypothetical protein
LRQLRQSSDYEPDRASIETAIRVSGPSALDLGDAISDANGLLHSLGRIVRTGLAGAPPLAALHAAEPSPKNRKQLPFRIVQYAGH